MTKDQYAAMTRLTRHVVTRLPLGEKLLRLPTLICAVLYLGILLFLFISKDARLTRVILVPACCFISATILRLLIGRERPYDAFSLPPVGAFIPGKKRSMPSRHAASAAAIAIAVAVTFPLPGVWIGMALLALLIAALRVLSGYHYPSDVAAALLLSGFISAVGYRLF